MSVPIRSSTLVGTLLLAMASMAQPSGWSLRRFDVGNGLPQSSVLDLAVDSLGFLWMTTEAGLVCFDGNRFKVISSKAAPNTTLRKREILRTGDHELLITDARGHLLMEHGHHTTFRIATGPRFVMNGEVPSYELAMALLDTTNRLCKEAGIDDRILFDHGKGTWGILGVKTYFYLHDTTIVSSWPVDFDIHRCWPHEGRLIAQVDGGRWMSIDPASGHRRELHREGSWPTPPDEEVLVLAPDPANAGYFSAQQRLFHLVVDGAAGTIAARDVGLALPEHAIPMAVALLDIGHTLAIGTANMGLLLYHRHQVQVLNARKEGETNSAYYAQVELPNGDVLVAGATHLARFEPSGKAHLYPGVPTPEWVSMAMTRDGRVLMTVRGHLSLLDPYSGILTQLDLPKVEPSAMLVEGDSIWVGNRLWLGYLDHELRLHKQFIIGSGADRDRPIAMARDRDGRLLMATCEAVLRARNTACTAFDTIPGFQGLCARSLSVQPEGTFIGTYGNGLWLLSKGDSLEAMPMDPLHALRYTHAIVRDSDGILWMSTNQGVVRCKASDLTTPAPLRGHTPLYGYLRELHGMETAELNGGIAPPSLLLRDGRLSFSSMNGLVRFHPDSITDPYPVSDFLLTDVKVDGVSWPVNEYVVLRKADREITFDVSTPYWGDPVNAQLEYRIPGINDEWLPVDLTTGIVLVTRPPAGTYAVHVRPVGSNVITDDDHAEVYFKVPLPFWRTITGYVVLIVGLALLVWIMIKLQSARLLRRQQELERMVDMRTVELDQRNRDLVRNLESREGLMAVISHDIVTPLRFIARAARSAIPMIGSQREADLRDTLSELSDSAEKLRGNASALLDWIKHDPNRVEPAWSVHDLHVEAESAMAIWQGVASERQMELRNAVPKQAIIRTDRIVLQVVLGNLIGNAVNHARNATCVEIEAHRDGDVWEIRVVDDGAGMDATGLQRAQHVLTRGWDNLVPHHAGTDGQGIGLAIAASMTHLLHGSISLESREGRTAITVRITHS